MITAKQLWTNQSFFPVSLKVFCISISYICLFDHWLSEPMSMANAIEIAWHSP